THVVRQVCSAVRFSNLCVLSKDAALFPRLKLFERAASTERVPHGPWPLLVENRLGGAAQHPVLQVRFIPCRIGASEHRHLVAHRQGSKSTPEQGRTHLVHEGGRIGAEREHAE